MYNPPTSQGPAARTTSHGAWPLLYMLQQNGAAGWNNPCGRWPKRENVRAVSSDMGQTPVTERCMEILLLAFSYVAVLGIGYRVWKNPGGTPLRWLTWALATASVLFVLWNSGREMVAGIA